MSTFAPRIKIVRNAVVAMFGLLLIFLVIDKIGLITTPSISEPVGFAIKGYSLEFLAGKNGIDIVAHPGQQVEVLKYTSTGDTQFTFYGLDTQPNINWYVASGGISQGQALTQELRIGPNTKPGVYQTVGQLVSQPNGGVTKIPIRVEVK